MFNEIDGFTFGMLFPIRLVKPEARQSPIKPPKIVNTIDSIKNCVKIF